MSPFWVSQPLRMLLCYISGWVDHTTLSLSRIFLFLSFSCPSATAAWKNGTFNSHTILDCKTKALLLWACWRVSKQANTTETSSMINSTLCLQCSGCLPETFPVHTTGLGPTGNTSIFLYLSLESYQIYHGLGIPLHLGCIILEQRMVWYVLLQCYVPLDNSPHYLTSTNCGYQCASETLSVGQRSLSTSAAGAAGKNT